VIAGLDQAGGVLRLLQDREGEVRIAGGLAERVIQMNLMSLDPSSAVLRQPGSFRLWARAARHCLPLSLGKKRQ
jgi:hypothetical protein